jgi:ferric-dicitrate binding protein FerR (iron transport regulator)
MFGHVTKLLTPYCHGELSSHARDQVEKHIARCSRCQETLDRVRFAAELCKSALVPTLIPDFPEHTIPVVRNSFTSRKTAVAILAAAAVLVLMVGTYALRQSRLPSWEVESASGAISKLRVGQSMETDGTNEATVKIAEIGRIRVERNTRLRLLETRPGEHRIKLERGTMHAQVWAPPRLFFVETTSATAIDLGCAYTLKVDDAGQSLLYVTTGLVELDSRGRASTVPAGDYAKTRKGAGPGTPYAAESSAAMQHAIDVIDFDPDAQAKTAAVETILTEVQPRDLVTLWHLLPRVDSTSRGHIYERMLTLSDAPEGVTVAGIMKLDPEMLGRWKSKLGLVWSQ